MEALADEFLQKTAKTALRRPSFATRRIADVILFARRIILASTVLLASSIRRSTM
jgi:hypothetical protein